MIVTVTLNPSLDEWMKLPSLRVGQLNRAKGFGRYPGGKGINVSRVIHELGGHTVAFGFAGGDDGLILRELMNRYHIRHEFVPVDGATRNNYKILTATPDALTEINSAGPAVSVANLRALAQRLFGYRPAPTCVVLSGSLPPGVPVTVYQRWIHRLRRLRIPAVLDASGEALRVGLTARPWLMKPNRDEMEELLQRRLRSTSQLIRAAYALRRRGVSVVILSLGGAGALIAAEELEGVWQAQSPPIQTDSAVGAGDSLIAGFVMGWRRRQPLLEAFRLGVACGTATAMTPGTELCHREAVYRLLRRVVITRVG